MKYGDLYSKLVSVAGENGIDISGNDKIKDFCEILSDMARYNFAKCYKMSFTDDKILISVGGLYANAWYFIEKTSDGFTNARYSKLFEYSDCVDISMENNGEPDGDPFTISFALSI